MASWTNIYPITKTRNVIDDNGEKLSDILNSSKIVSGLIEESVGSSNNIVGNYVLFPSGFFVLTYPKVEMTILTQPLYNRAYINFPFELDPNSYVANITLVSGGGLSIGDVKNVYVRTKSASRLEISTINAVNAGADDKVLVDVIVSGVRS